MAPMVNEQKRFFASAATLCEMTVNVNTPVRKADLSLTIIILRTTALAGSTEITQTAAKNLRPQSSRCIWRIDICFHAVERV
jgi:hypothetical protein